MNAALPSVTTIDFIRLAAGLCICNWKSLPQNLYLEDPSAQTMSTQWSVENFVGYVSRHRLLDTD